MKNPPALMTLLIPFEIALRTTKKPGGMAIYRISAYRVGQ